MSPFENARAGCVRAINERRVVQFEYQGHPRTVTPMAVGRDVHGKQKLRGLQVGGTSSKGSPDPEVPKLFFLEEIVNLVVTSAAFEVPTIYTKNDSALDRIDAEL